MDMSVVGSNIAARAAPAPTDAPASTPAPIATLGDTVTSTPLPPLTDPDKVEAPDRRECYFTIASFGHKSAAPNHAGHRRIDAAMEKVHDDGYKVLSVVIVGHIDASEEPTDGTDDPDMDMLGLSRAATTRSYFARIFKMRIDNIHIEDAGATDPAPAPASGAQPQAALNRRVEITLKQRKRSALQADDDQNDADGVVICRLQRAAAASQCV